MRMNTPSAAFLSLATSMLAGCTNWSVREGPVSAPVAAASARTAAGAEPDQQRSSCLWGKRDSKPNTPEYRGGCLELAEYLQSDQGLPESLFSPGAKEATPLQVTAFVREKLRPVTLEPVPAPLAQLQSVRTFKARDEQNQDLCASEVYEDPAMKQSSLLSGLAIAVPGYWSKGKWVETVDGHPVFTLSCISGVVAMCALWGYDPLSDNGRYHHACVHALRARYRDDDMGKSYTCPHTKIDIYDRMGKLRPSHMKGFTLESLWNENGLVCIQHPRWSGCKALEGLPSCSTMPDKQGGGWPDGSLIAIESLEGRRTPHGKCPTEQYACP